MTKLIVRIGGNDIQEDTINRLEEYMNACSPENEIQHRVISVSPAHAVLCGCIALTDQSIIQSVDFIINNDIYQDISCVVFDNNFKDENDAARLMKETTAFKNRNNITGLYIRRSHVLGDESFNIIPLNIL